MITTVERYKATRDCPAGYITARECDRCGHTEPVQTNVDDFDAEHCDDCAAIRAAEGTS